MAHTAIHEEAYQALMNKLGEAGPILRERSFNVLEGFQVKDSEGTEATYSYFDVVYRADESYWSPLGDEDRLTLYDVTDYQVKDQTTDRWLAMPEWFNNTK
jgi:hypothetical protein